MTGSPSPEQREVFGAWAERVSASAPTPGSQTDLAYSDLRGARREAVLEADRRVAALASRRGSRPVDPELLAAFRASPMTGLTTVLDLARREAGYNPLAPTQGGGGPLTRFLVLLISGGHFLPPEALHESFEIDPSRAGFDVGASVRRFIGDDPFAGPAIRRQLEEVLGRAAAHLGERQESDLMMEYALEADAAYRFTMVRSSVEIAVVMMPPSKYLTQGRGMRGGFVFKFDSAGWPARAEEVLARHLATVTDWLEGTNNLRSG